MNIREMRYELTNLGWGRGQIGLKIVRNKLELITRAILVEIASSNGLSSNGLVVF